VQGNEIQLISFFKRYQNGESFQKEEKEL